MKTLIALSAVVLLAACGKNNISHDTLETARAQAKENAEFNARSWRQQTPAYAELGLISRGDSTQRTACPQGDGWASLDLVDKATGAVRVKLKCSTYSGAIGCRTDTPASEDRCSSEAPHPLPKIAK